MRNSSLWIFEFIHNMKFSTKLLSAFIIITFIPIIALSAIYHKDNLTMVMEQHSTQLYDSIIKNNLVVDERLSRIEEAYNRLISDKEILEIFEDIDPEDEFEILKKNRTITQMLAKYFLYIDDVYSANLVTSYYTFGDGFFPYKAFNNTDIKQRAEAKGGGIIWKPTYDFPQVFNLDYLMGYDYIFKYLFTFSGKLNSFHNYTTYIKSLSDEKERPILVVNFYNKFYEKIYKNNLKADYITYYTITETGDVVYSSHKEDIGTVIKPEWLDIIALKKTGIINRSIDRQDTIICFDQSKVNGWYSVALVDTGPLKRNANLAIAKTSILMVAISLFISLIMSFVLSRTISKPIQRLQHGLMVTGTGDFNFKIPTKGYNEFDRLNKTFNDMNHKIRRLIKENYEIKLLREKAEFKALNMQMNPHILYNTLNLINCMAKEEGQESISNIIISLSNMLHYTVNNNKELSTLEDEIKYLKDYVHVISCRFEDRFRFNFEIEPIMFSYKVPRLFLQPFVENSIIHGFKDMEENCIVEISSWIDRGTCYYLVKDNGCGFDTTEMIDSSSVGIHNVDKRVKLLYGKEYGVEISSKVNEGTSVMIKLPLYKL